MSGYRSATHEDSRKAARNARPAVAEAPPVSPRSGAWSFTRPMRALFARSWWWRCNRVAARMSAVSDHLLSDIGFERSAIALFCQVPAEDFEACRRHRLAA